MWPGPDRKNDAGTALMERRISLVMGIPIIVGVTGHRALREKDIPELRAKVKKELEELASKCPHSELVMLNAAASGADQLCAEIALELGIRLVCPIPFPVDEYRKDFSEEETAVFDGLLRKADSVFPVPDIEAAPQEPSPKAYRNFRYRQAGIYIARHSHVLLALWDGSAPKRDGCGTAEIVDFALAGSYLPADGPALYHSGKAVIHIPAPREETDDAPRPRRFLGEEQAFQEILEKTDAFNRIAGNESAPEEHLLPEGSGRDPLLKRMEELYQSAETLSMKAAGTYRRVLAALAVSGTVLTLAFLLYDEAELCGMILLCGAMLVCAAACLRHAVRSDCHARYVDCRALAESLRVQAFLRYAGSAKPVADLFSWTQLSENGWIAAAMNAVTIGDGPSEAHDISACWAEDQRIYHEKASRKKALMLERNDRLVKAAGILSIVLYLAVLLFELTLGGLSLVPGAAAVDLDFYRAGFKIALGSLSAATLFASGYYGKLSLSRQVSDHEKMERFYKKIGEQLALWGQSEELLTRLAREELMENGNWCSYQRDNAPDLSI